MPDGRNLIQRIEVMSVNSAGKLNKATAVDEHFFL